MKVINRPISLPLLAPLLTMVSVTVLLIGCESIGLKKADHSVPTTTTQEIPPPTPTPAPVEAPTSYEDVWDRIRAGYALPDVSNSDVDKQIRFYTTNKNYFTKVIEQSEPYLHYVASEMEANGIPLELVLLPYIESAYNPTAVSPGQNVGMWQIATITGRNFGLKKNSWYDGRKDVIASTDAAIRLLKKLNAMFDNDWLLTVAAYNAGEGSVRNAINKNKRAGKPTDFWSLPLSKTTQGYIPQLLALSKIVADPDRYNFTLHPIPDTPYFVKVNVHSQINLTHAAQNNNLDVAKLKKLNAGYSGGLTDPTGSHQVLVPVAAAEAFKVQLDSLPKTTAVKLQEYIVKKGDSLGLIAKKYGVNSASIKSANNLKNEHISIGQRLQIPVSANNIATVEPEKINTLTSSEKNAVEKNYYIVKPGDNLSSIAKSLKMSVSTLTKLNNINSPAILKPGQKLIVSSEKTAEEVVTQ